MLYYNIYYMLRHKLIIFIINTINNKNWCCV